MKMGEVPILDTLKKIPGGIMFIPLLIGAAFNTFVPEWLKIGSLTTALFKSGALCLIGVLLLCTGAQISFKSSGRALYKGVVLNFSKVLLGVIPAIIVGKMVGPTGTIWGLSALALVNMSNSNGGLYGGLVSRYGDKEDLGALAIISTNDGPFYEMVALGVAGVAVIPISALIAVIVPVIVGMILGNLDKKIAEFLEPGIFISIFLFSFPLGAGLNFGMFAQAGAPAILLGFLTLLITGAGSYFVYMLLIPKNQRKTCVPGAAVGTIAGNAVATPAAIASVDPAFASIAPIATIQVGAAIVMTAILCPVMCEMFFRWEKKRAEARGEKLEINTDLELQEDKEPEL